ncbi:MAG: DUF1295 domain-containing protein [Candidatus Izemoplasmatales bacterium]|nr:DUF1295 domain-containing protein [Candidatus Izemoplasmatales bacterium]
MDLTSLSRKNTLWVFVIVYLFAFLVGSLVISYGVNNNYDPIMTGLLSTTIMTIIVFISSVITKNASMYDPYWSVVPILLAFEWMLIYKNFSLNVILLMIAILFWGIRLTYNWWKNWQGFKHQDWRYTHLKNQAPKIYLITNFFGIHMIPTLVVYIQLINAHDIMLFEGVNLIFIVGFALSIVAPIIQFVADKQMYEFRMNHTKNKSCIDQGLWKYSRHPNYLGELTFWVGIYIMYFSNLKVINFNLIYPILMILLFMFISIPMMEKKLSNRPGYLEYKEKVSMILPFRKKA